MDSLRDLPGREALRLRAEVRYNLCSILVIVRDSCRVMIMMLW